MKLRIKKSTQDPILFYHKMRNIYELGSAEIGKRFSEVWVSEMCKQIYPTKKVRYAGFDRGLEVWEVTLL